MLTKNEQLALAACVAGSVAALKLLKSLSSWYASRQKADEWIPIGRIRELYVFPVKSCKPKHVFSLFCDRLGVRSGENCDRMFLVVDENGKFLIARTEPHLVTVECEVSDGILHLQYGDITAECVVSQAFQEKRLIRATLLNGLKTDGYDCGEEAAEFFAKVLNHPGARLIVYESGLYSERTCVTSQNWWNNPVPKRADEVAYPNLAPFMVTTQASLDALNKYMDRNGNNGYTSVQFRANIIVEGCPEWDEDKWSDLKFGDVELQCFKPCQRCIMTTVDPVTGEKDKAQQPWRKMKEFRLAPEGKVRDAHGYAPIFGVNAGLMKKGYIHEGQIVWAKYKKSAF